MIRLTKIFDLLGLDTFVSIENKYTEIYSGECGKCTRDIWRNAFVKRMRFDVNFERYFIEVIYK